MLELLGLVLVLYVFLGLGWIKLSRHLVLPEYGITLRMLLPGLWLENFVRVRLVVRLK
jgi:hypothetical protein